MSEKIECNSAEVKNCNPVIEQSSGNLQGRKITNNLCRNTTIAISAFIGGAACIFPIYILLYTEYAPFTTSEIIYLTTVGLGLGGSGCALGGLAAHTFTSKSNTERHNQIVIQNV